MSVHVNDRIELTGPAEDSVANLEVRKLGEVVEGVEACACGRHESWLGPLDVIRGSGESNSERRPLDKFGIFDP